MFGETKKGIISFDEYKAIPMEQRKKTLQNLLNNHTRREIAEAWGTSVSNVDNHKRRVGIRSDTELADRLSTQPEKPKEPAIKSIPSNFNVTLMAYMDGDKLEKRLLDIAGLLLANNKYIVKLELVEEIEDHEV